MPCFAKAILLPSLALAAGLALASMPAAAEPTEITVRVLGKDSKFIGSSMGGARVVLRDADTGEILAQGITKGGTGDTSRIMHENKGRRAILSDDSAAHFTATIDIDEPRPIEAEVYGPLGQRQGANHATQTQWVVPGEHLTGGDGWVLELPGYVVDLLSPPAHVNLPPNTTEVPVRANVTLMCGCPITPGGLWDADKLKVRALVTRNGEKQQPIDLAFAGQTSQFEAAIPVFGAGLYDITVYAYSPESGNTGIDRTSFIVAPK